MIQAFINIFMSRKGELEIKYRTNHPEGYGDIVKDVVTLLSDTAESGDKPDPSRIVTIDHGNYQGTCLYVIGAYGYQPRRYWYVFVDYGSCSGCDTLERIKSASYKNDPTEEQVADYLMLALHIIQGLKCITPSDD